MMKKLLYETNQVAIFIEHAYVYICQKVFYIWIKMNDLNQQLMDKIERMEDKESNYA